MSLAAFALGTATGMATSLVLVWAAWRTALSKTDLAHELLGAIYERASGRTSREMIRAAHRHWVARTHDSADGEPCPTCGWTAP